MNVIGPGDITGLVLAGGRGSRMGGVDKGLQDFQGAALALHAMRRLRQQEGGLIGPLLVNANRNAAVYESFGAPVCPDPVADFAGPLAGFLAGLAHCETDWMLTVPCDSPRFPLDLAQRMAQAVMAGNADIAMASAREGDDQYRSQPVFCLMKVSLRESLEAYLCDGGRKVDRWTGLHRSVLVPFDRPSDDPLAFSNANTLDELRSLEISNRTT